MIKKHKSIYIVYTVKKLYYEDVSPKIVFWFICGIEDTEVLQEKSKL